MKNYVQQNKYLERNITEHKHSHHDEMKTGTEYKKSKHRITQDEEKRTEEIELRKLRSLLSKSSNTDMSSTQHSNEEMKELRK